MGLKDALMGGGSKPAAAPGGASPKGEQMLQMITKLEQGMDNYDIGLKKIESYLPILQGTLLSKMGAALSDSFKQNNVGGSYKDSSQRLSALSDKFNKLKARAQAASSQIAAAVKS